MKNPAIVIPVTIGIITLAVWALALISAANNTAREVNLAASSPTVTAVDSELQEPVAGPTSEAPALSAQEAPTEPEPSTTQLEPETPPAAPAGIPYAAQMTAAGIAESDHAIVAHLLLDENGILKNVGSYGVKVAAEGGSPTERLMRVNGYVVSRYATWSNASAFADSNEGRW